MQYFSTIYVLFALQAAFLWRIFAAAHRRGSAVVFTLSLSAIGGASTWLALTGAYEHPGFLASLPGLWLPAVVFVVVAVLLLLSALRSAVIDVAAATPDHWLVAIQALRVTAAGTLIRTLQGQFPHHMEYAVGLTDLVFGLSALILFGPAKRGTISSDALVIWHLTGLLIILVPGGIAIQSGLPGPLAVYDYLGPHSSAPILRFPMVLAPSLVVPIFLLFNVLGAWSAYKRRRAAFPPDSKETPT
ncbi:MAG: hypothetical protein AAGA41_08090 [Pseudomonadota bacterium]